MANPNVLIFVEQIAPIKESEESMDLISKVKEFNQLIGVQATNTSQNPSKVIAEDMLNNWSNKNFADDVHYN